MTLRNVPAFLERATRSSSSPDGPLVYDLAFGGNFYAIVDAATLGLEVDPERAPELIDAGARVMAAIDASDRPVHPEDERIAGCRHVDLHTRPGRDGADARAATRSTPAGSTARPAAPGRARGWPSCTPAASSRSDTPFVNESVIGTRFTGRLVGGDRGRRAAGGDPRDHRPRVDHRDGPVPARPERPVPGRLRACERRRRRSSAPASSAPRRRARWPGAASSVELSTRGEVSGGTTGLGEGNVLCSDKDAGPGARPRACSGRAAYDEIEARATASGRGSGARAR